MKLLFDQNISHRIVKMISASDTEVKQVRDLGLENLSDKEIWKFARNNHFSIITFDSDFYELTNLYGIPPKIIWLRTRNLKTLDLARVIMNKLQLIEEFVSNPTYKELACLEIDG